MENNKGLTERRRRFVAAYAAHPDATAAARAAGYSQKTAHVAASKLLRHPAVVLALAERLAPVLERYEVTVDRVIHELACIAFATPADVLAWGPDGVTLRPSEALTEDQERAVESVTQTVTQGGGTIRVKMHDKVRALDLLARHLGMYPEPPPAQVTNVVPVQIIVSGHENV